MWLGGTQVRGSSSVASPDAKPEAELEVEGLGFKAALWYCLLVSVDGLTCSATYWLQDFFFIMQCGTPVELTGGAAAHLTYRDRLATKRQCA